MSNKLIINKCLEYFSTQNEQSIGISITAYFCQTFYQCVRVMYCIVQNPGLFERGQ